MQTHHAQHVSNQLPQKIDNMPDACHVPTQCEHTYNARNIIRATHTMILMRWRAVKAVTARQNERRILCTIQTRMPLVAVNQPLKIQGLRASIFLCYKFATIHSSLHPWRPRSWPCNELMHKIEPVNLGQKYVALAQEFRTRHQRQIAVNSNADINIAAAERCTSGQ